MRDVKAAERYADPEDVAYVRVLYFVAERQRRQVIDAFGQYLCRYPGYTPAIEEQRCSHCANLHHINRTSKRFSILTKVKERLLSAA